MSYKDTKMYSILSNKCPHCHEGNFFEDNNPYKLKTFAHMNNRCPVCNEDFKRETGFYFGATYVSYALTVAFGVGLYILLSVIGNMDTVPFLITFSILLIILLPVFYRLARLTWINMFVGYKKTNKAN
ncbi:MAG: hypothetical protein JWP12_988 [Bacteroidetes bacterium]|nr:hypothetical protein [Bacteroidota bacterium]